jgi:hypothetical protein
VNPDNPNPRPCVRYGTKLWGHVLGPLRGYAESGMVALQDFLEVSSCEVRREEKKRGTSRAVRAAHCVYRILRTARLAAGLLAGWWWLLVAAGSCW